MSDRAYINLVRHLTRSTSTLPFETLQGSIAHYLARPPAPIPGSPTPLTATVIGSPLFHTYTYQRLSALSVAFRHAVHIRVAVQKERAERHPAGWLSKGENVPASLAKWVKAVLAGFDGGSAVVRLACACGLLLGLEDWETELKLKQNEAKARAKVEEEIVVALAEVVDEYNSPTTGWEMDFKQTTDGDDEDVITVAVLLASQCASFVASQRLQALPLPAIVDVLIAMISRSFRGGTFLSAAPLSASTDDEGRLAISPTSVFAQTVRNISGSTYASSMAALAKFTVLALTTLVESRLLHGWETIGRTLTCLQTLTETVEQDWSQCPLAVVSEDAELADNSRDIATITWSLLKTLLFTTLMITQSILAATVFIPNPSKSKVVDASQESSLSLTVSSSHSIALTVLRTLGHLSFVMPQFGGVASTSDSGLPELKRAFYLALDILSASDVDAGHFVQELCHANMEGKGKEVDNIPKTLLNAKRAFALACVEQLVPVLSEPIIQSQVYPLCYPHLWDPSHRETYESAHSVMLAVFASYAQNSRKEPLVTSLSVPAFAEKLVPMYAQCLTENSSDGGLSTPQLCLAYAALVRSASSFGYANGAASDELGEHAQADSMAWFCIEVLLDAIRLAPFRPARATLPYASETTPGPSSASASIASPEMKQGPSEHLHRLRLALVATVPSVSLTLLPRLLTEIKAIIVSLSSPLSSGVRAQEMREELINALFKAISQDVGDLEKGYAIDWWYENREGLVYDETSIRHPVYEGAEHGAQTSSPQVVSRL